MMDEWQRRMKEEKEKERLKQKESAEMLQGYRGNEIREEDKKLKLMKEEERKKQQETAKILQGYRSSGISEEERKLKAMKEEERKKQQEAESLLHSFKKTEEPEAKARPQKREEQSYPEPVNKSLTQQKDLTYISPGSVAEKKKSFNSQYQPSGMDSTALNRSKNLQDVPFMEVVDEPAIPEDIGQRQPNTSDKTNVVDAVDQEPEKHDDQIDTDVETTTGSHELEEKEVRQETVEAETAETKEESHCKQNENEEEEPDCTLIQDQSECRFDVYFSFGIITDKGNTTLSAYMNAVSQVIQEKIPNNHPTSRIRCDLDCQPYVVDEKVDNNYVDTRNRPGIRRLIITAAVPLMLSKGVSKEEAQQLATSALAESIRSQAFLNLLAKE